MRKTFRQRPRGNVARGPVLTNVLVDPMMLEGSAVEFKLLLKFSTAHGFVDIEAARSSDGDEIERQAIEIKRALGIA